MLGERRHDDADGGGRRRLGYCTAPDPRMWLAGGAERSGAGAEAGGVGASGSGLGTGLLPL